MTTIRDVSLANTNLVVKLTQARRIIEEGGTPTALLWDELDECVAALAEAAWLACQEQEAARRRAITMAELENGTPPSAA